MSPRRQSDDGELLPDLFGEARWGRLSERIGLTQRQSQVARLICRGCADKQIARRLGVSHGSVRLHIKKLFARLGVRGRLGLLVHLVVIDRRCVRPARRRHRRRG
jgi:DNA-binding NarL/FixJ family response regulator